MNDDYTLGSASYVTDLLKVFKSQMYGRFDNDEWGPSSDTSKLIMDLVQSEIENETKFNESVAAGWHVVKMPAEQRLVDVIAWCKKSASGEFAHYHRKFSFINKDDAMMFALRWGNDNV